MAEDIKENEMQNGKPARLRGIDADGNSITPTMEEVTDALPGEQKYDRGASVRLAFNKELSNRFSDETLL